MAVVIVVQFPEQVFVFNPNTGEQEEREERREPERKRGRERREEAIVDGRSAELIHSKSVGAPTGQLVNYCISNIVV